MSTPTGLSHPKQRIHSADVEGFDSLSELALDLRSSWNHATDEVWRQLDPALWEFTYNPWVVLQTVSRKKLQRVLAEPAFRKKVDDLVQARRDSGQAPAWFQKTHRHAALTAVAYFSMEFMLSEALPIYSGGLGNVAGDQLKAASDLGVPVIGVGLLYSEGYFRQVIDRGGAQQALYQGRSEAIEARRHGRMRGEEIARPRHVQRDVERLGAALHEIASSLQHRKGRVPFI